MSPSGSLDELALELARRLSAGEDLGDAPLQALLAAAVQRYGGRRSEGDALPVWGGDVAVSATDVVVTVMAMLEAADVAVFELGMWQALGRD